TIAQKFDGVSPDDILLWNNIDDARKIQVGQKLTIYTKE
ncbi:MAG: LysM peptidoglycan-binding domain-containing protein, partial [Prolixibacteraceae bacterium]|nr:LysM peptidoglycan-binding domain-containing protein [Prolixibacteraceae bacterium]